VWTVLRCGMSPPSAHRGAALHEHLREISRVHPFMAITHVDTLATDIRSPAEQQINPDAKHVDPAEPITVRDAPLVSRQLR